MKKPQIAEKLAKQVGISSSQAMKLLNALFSTRRGKGMVLSELEAGRAFRIAGFGTFRIKKRKARKGRNPKTGAVVSIPARRYIVFSTGAGAKDRITG